MEKQAASEFAAAEQASAAAFVVVCLCADWCAVCREYAAGFRNLADCFPAVRFHWLDIEVDAEDLGDLEVENFPTLLIRHGAQILFFGTMPPVPRHLKRTLETFLRQNAAENRDYVLANSERRAWQEDRDLQRLGHGPHGRIAVAATGD